MNEDRFGDALDAIVTDAEMLDPDPLATFALALQAAEGAPATDRLDADRRASIWRTLMTDHAHHHPKSGGPGPLSQPAMAMPTNPWTPRPGSVTRRSGIMPFASRVQTAFTAFAVLAIILAAWTGFAAFRETGGPSVTPTAFAHGAASATPSASTAAENEWLTWVQPEECNVAPLSESELATIMSTSESTSAHMYSPLTIPDAEDAREVARTARTILACGVEVPSVLMTSHYIAEIERLVNDTDYLETQRALYIARGKQISEAYRESVPADFVLLSPVEPSVGALGYAYLPQKSVQFPDGRIGVPRAMLFWEGVDNPTQEEIDSMPYFLAELLIFVNDSSMWKLDERLTFCVGDCDAAWEWAANPEGPAPWSTPVASPAFSPAAENEWLIIITPGECQAQPMSLEDYAALIRESREWPVRAVTPLQPVDASIAEDVARAAREHDACQLGGTRRIKETDHYVYVTSNTAFNPITREERWARGLQRGMEISAQFPIQEPASFRFLTSQTVMRDPATGELFGYTAYLPTQAVALADGSVAIPQALLYAKGDPIAPTPEEIVTSSGFATYLMIFSNESGQWLLDERLPFCVGDCTEYWNSQLTELRLPTVEASPVASPISTPMATPVN